MATKTQYEVFQFVHDAEDKRMTELVTRAKVYLSIATFFLGGLAFKMGDPVLLISTAAQIIYFVAAGLFILAFSFILAALFIYSYEGVTDLIEVIEEFQAKPPSDTDFLDDRIVDLAIACDRNVRQNDKRAVLLQIASFVMLLGVLAASASFVAAVAAPRPESKPIQVEVISNDQESKPFQVEVISSGED